MCKCNPSTCQGACGWLLVVVAIRPCVGYCVYYVGGTAKKVDLDAVPQIGGQSIFEIELDPEKPWKMPGKP